MWLQHPLRGWIERNIHFKLPACQSLCTCDLCVLMLSFTFFTVLPSLLWSVSPFLPPPLYISVLSQWVNCFIIYLLYINFEGLLLVVSSIFVVFLFSNSTLLHNNTVGLVLCCIKMQFFSLCFVCFISDYVSISLCCSPPACPSLSILHVRSVFLN